MGSKDAKGKKDVVDDSDKGAVLNVDTHCEDCALKIKRYALKCKGVEKVTFDEASNKLTVIGDFDPSMLRDRVEAGFHQKAKIVSDNPNIKPSTVRLNIRLDCIGCIKRVKKLTRKFKGVREVLVNAEEDLVTVTGIMDVDSLKLYLKNKLIRNVEIVS